MQPNTPTPSRLTVMSGADGHTILLTAEEAALYHLHVTRFFTDYAPVTQTECELVGRLALTEWRLNRLARVEMGLFAAAHLEFDHLFADQDPNVRDLLIENHIVQVYSRQLKDLSLQESRLGRYFAKDEAHYLTLQKTRLDQEQTPTSSPEVSVPAAPRATALARSALFQTSERSETGGSFATFSTSLVPLHDRPSQLVPAKTKTERPERLASNLRF